MHAPVDLLVVVMIKISCGGGGDFICLGVILPSYAFVPGDRKWNWAPTAINDARWNLLKKRGLTVERIEEEGEMMRRTERKYIPGTNRSTWIIGPT